MNRLIWLLFVFFFSILPVHANRDIVYAARYYNPPGSHGTSHFHLYRINPNGTGRTQLTYGDYDDTCPQWSPDGRHILFLRGEGTVCIADADGRIVHTLANLGGNNYATNLQWLPDGQAISFIHSHSVGVNTTSALWVLNWKTDGIHRYPGATTGEISPDGRSLLVDAVSGISIVNRRTGVSQRLTPWYDLIWLGDDRLVGYSDDAPMTLHFVRHGKATEKALTMHPPQPNPWGDDLTDGSGWLLPSPQPGTTVYALNEHNSTVGALAAFFRVNLADGAMRFLAQGQFLVWSPEGKRFCTAPGRDCWTYRERKWDGTFKTVWAAPLQVGTPGGKLKTITPGLVWVTGADWRKQ